MIINLFDNAVAAIGEAGPGPRTVARLDPRSTRRVGTIHCRSRTPAPGIRPRTARALFEPDFSTKRAGTGLGLAIVSRIVTDHSGYVRVAATPAARQRASSIELPASRSARSPWPAHPDRRRRGERAPLVADVLADEGYRRSRPRAPTRPREIATRRSPTWCCSTSPCPAATASRCSSSCARAPAAARS